MKTDEIIKKLEKQGLICCTSEHSLNLGNTFHKLLMDSDLEIDIDAESCPESVRCVEIYNKKSGIRMCGRMFFKSKQESGIKYTYKDTYFKNINSYLESVLEKRKQELNPTGLK